MATRQIFVVREVISRVCVWVKEGYRRGGEQRGLRSQPAATTPWSACGEPPLPFHGNGIAQRSQRQVAAALLLLPLGDSRGQIISRPSALNETPPMQPPSAHKSRHTKFRWWCCFCFHPHQRQASYDATCERCFTQPTQLLSGGP